MELSSRSHAFLGSVILTIVIPTLSASGIKVDLKVLHAVVEDHIHLQCAILHQNTTVVSISWSKDGHMVGYFNISQAPSTTIFRQFLGHNATIDFNKTKQFQDIQIFTPQKDDEGLYLCQIKGKTNIGKFETGSAATWVKLSAIKSDVGINILFFIITVVLMVVGMYAFLHCYLKFCNVTTSKKTPEQTPKHRRKIKKVPYVPPVDPTETEQHISHVNHGKTVKFV